MKTTALLAGVAALALSVSGAYAADLILPTEPAPVFESAAFDFEGFYLGVQGGGLFAQDLGLGLVGVVAGANFAAGDAFLLGAEVQANGLWGDMDAATGDNDFAWDVNAVLKAGAVVTDGVFTYALAGAGVANTDVDAPAVDESITYWKVGAGVEVAVSDAFSIRGEAAYVRDFDDTPVRDAGVFTVGALWHFN